MHKFLTLFLGLAAVAWPASYYTQRPNDAGAVLLTAERFAVKGDGVADDTAALQQAINQVQETTRMGVVLVPEGRVVISGLNPISLWGARQARAHACARMGVTALGASRLYLPEAGEFIGHWRLRDWLRLLSFEVDDCHFGAYRPAVRSQKWLQRWRWRDRWGARWWPVLGAVYFITAVKRVRGLHVLGPAWKPRPASAAAPAVASRRGHPKTR